MELLSRFRWVIILLIMIIFIGLVAWGLFSITRNIFTRTSDGLGNNSATSVEIEEAENTLRSAGIATFEVDGPVVANEEHRSYVITVTSAQTNIKLYERYGAKVIEQKSYPNTQDAFDAFMSALANENILAEKSNVDGELTFAEEGVCARGRRYIMEIDSSIRRWTTSCSSKDGNADFSMSRVRALFQRQIPDFSDVVRGSGL